MIKHVLFFAVFGVAAFFLLRKNNASQISAAQGAINDFKNTVSNVVSELNKPKSIMDSAKSAQSLDLVVVAEKLTNGADKLNGDIEVLPLGGGE